MNECKALWNKYNVDIQKLSRDYLNNPIPYTIKTIRKNGVILYNCDYIIPYDDFYYMYITLNVGFYEIDKMFNCPPYIIRKQFNKLKLKKPKELWIKRSEETCLLKYGRKNVFSGEEGKKLCINSYKKKYGDNIINVSQVEEVKQKKVNTNLLRRGVSNPQQDEKVKLKTKNTNILKYGGPAPICSDEIKEKIKQTNRLKYNCDWNIASQYSLEKQRITRNNNKWKGFDSSAEMYLYNIIKKWYPDVISHYNDQYYYPWNCDFYIPSLGCWIEYQGHWMHGGMPWDPDNEKCLIQYDDWINKEKNNHIYSTALKMWLHDDVKKRERATLLELPYIEWWPSDYHNLKYHLDIYEEQYITSLIP